MMMRFCFEEVEKSHLRLEKKNKKIECFLSLFFFTWSLKAMSSFAPCSARSVARGHAAAASGIVSRGGAGALFSLLLNSLRGLVAR